MEENKIAEQPKFEIYECLMCGEILDYEGKFCSDECANEYYWENRTCETCGGEFWNGGTSCTCEDWEEDDFCPCEECTAANDCAVFGCDKIKAMRGDPTDPEYLPF